MKIHEIVHTFDNIIQANIAVTVMIFARDLVTNLRRKAWEYLVKPDRGNRQCAVTLNN